MSRGYEHLRSHWWHRLATVVFFTSVPAVLLIIWISANRSELASYESCLNARALSNLRVDRPFDQGCVGFAPQPFANFIIAAIAALLWSYVIQLVYRVAVYVALGSKSEWN